MYHPKKLEQKTILYPCVIDIENNPDTGELCDVGIGYGGRTLGDYETYDSWQGFYDSLVRRCGSPPVYAEELDVRYTLWAHNGAAYDFPHMVQWLEQQNLLEDVFYIMSQSMAIGVDLKISGISETIHCRDSLRLIPGSLARLSADFGLEDAGKLALDKLPHEVKQENPELYYSYLQHDIQALQQILFKFHSKIEAVTGPIGLLPATVGSLALRTWMIQRNTPFYTPRLSNTDYNDLEQAAYSGGRTECYEAGEYAAVKVDDANSLYPSVMLDGDFPAYNLIPKTYHYEPDQLGLYKIRYQQTNRDIPPLLRHLMPGQAGEFRYTGAGVYTSDELAYGIAECGLEFEVDHGYIFPITSKLFHDYIERWWKIRLEAQKAGDRTMQLIAKNLMNNLYGKFGQRNQRESIVLHSDEAYRQHLADGHDVTIHGNYMTVKEYKYTPHRFTAVAAMVTARGRIVLHRRMCAVLAAGGTLLACDTDSVHYTGPDLANGSELGEWKREGEGNSVYLGPKLYARQDISGETIIHSKGVNPKTLSYEDFRAALASDRLATASLRPPSVRATLYGGATAGQWRPLERTLHVTAERTWDKVG